MLIRNMIVYRIYDQLGKKNTFKTMIVNLEDNSKGKEMQNSFCTMCFHD